MAVKLHIQDGAYWYNLPESAQEKVEKDLTFPNPEYENAKKQGAYIPSYIPSEIAFFEKEDNNYYTPKGYIYYLKKFLAKKNVAVKIKDNSAIFPKMELSFNGKLRKYQKNMVNGVTSYPVGMVEALTGAGKTVTAMGIIYKIKQPTLILVHSKELLDQWQESIQKFLGYNCGIMGGGKVDIKDITVAIINTAEKHLDKLTKRFGMLICDEGHRAAGKRFRDVIIRVEAKFHYLLSATPFRQDGLTNVLYALFGPKTKTDVDHLRDKGYVLVPDVHRVQTGFRHVFINYSAMITALCFDDVRNNLIAQCADNDYKRNKQSIIIVSDRKNHLDEIKSHLKIKSEILTGGTKTSERKRISDNVKAGRVKCLLSTGQLISEGYDAPNLSAIILATPIRDRKKLIQIVGRCLRPSDGANPRVYDIRDSEVNILRYSGFARDKIYRSEWKQ